MSTLCSNAKLSTCIVTDQYALFSACIKVSGTFFTNPYLYCLCQKISEIHTKRLSVRRCEFAYCFGRFWKRGKYKYKTAYEKMCQYIRVGRHRSDCANFVTCEQHICCSLYIISPFCMRLASFYTWQAGLNLPWSRIRRHIF